MVQHYNAEKFRDFSNQCPSKSINEVTAQTATSTCHSEQNEAKECTEPKSGNKPVKVSAWIYPKVHQEIYEGRPKDFLGDARNRSRPRSENLLKSISSNGGKNDKAQAWIYPKDHQELNDFRHSEWLGRVEHSSPTLKTWKSSATNLTSGLKLNPLDEIHGSPVKNSPFLAMQKQHD